MKFINLTRRIEIGANCYYLETASQRLVLDCGMHPKLEGEEALPNFKPIADRKLDAILVSHAHLDHIGTLPVLMGRQPDARVFMSDTTTDIGNVLLHNSVNVMKRQREELGVTMYPLYTHRSLDRIADQWQSCRLNQRVTLRGERATAREADGITFELFDAGHVLGSCGILLNAEGRKVFYSGDVNFDDQTIAKAAVFPESGIDVLIIEATHGNTPLPENFSREEEERRFVNAIDRAFTNGGSVLIPVFALGKTQEVLAIIYKFRREKLLGDFPLYIGGLSTGMTEIYDERSHSTRRQWPRLQLLPELDPFVLTGKTVGEAPPRGGRVYALSSGMMTPKTLSNIFARRIIENPKHSIFFVGYADPDSPAGILKAAQRGDRVMLDPDGEPQEVRCNIEEFQFSAHASRESIVNYVKRLAPKKVILVHGDPPAVEWVRAQIAAALPASEVIVPTPGVEIEI